MPGPRTGRYTYVVFERLFLKSGIEAACFSCSFRVRDVTLLLASWLFRSAFSRFVYSVCAREVGGDGWVVM